MAFVGVYFCLAVWETFSFRCLGGVLGACGGDHWIDKMDVFSLNLIDYCIIIINCIASRVLSLLHLAPTVCKEFQSPLEIFSINALAGF